MKHISNYKYKKDDWNTVVKALQSLRGRWIRIRRKKGPDYPLILCINDIRKHIPNKWFFTLWAGPGFFRLFIYTHTFGRFIKKIILYRGKVPLGQIYFEVLTIRFPYCKYKTKRKKKI